MNSRINATILPPIQAIEVTGRNGLCSTTATIAALRCRADSPLRLLRSCLLAAALVALPSAFAAPPPAPVAADVAQPYVLKDTEVHALHPAHLARDSERFVSLTSPSRRR
jgi:hypothetical protein